MENHLALAPFHIENPLVAQHARAVDVDDGAQKVFQLCRVKGAIGFEYKAFDVVIDMVVVPMVAVRRVVAVLTMVIVIMVVVLVPMVMGVRRQEIRVDIELGVQIEAAQVKKVLDGDFAKVHQMLGCARIHVLEPVLQFF